MDTATRTTSPALTSRHYGAVNWLGLQTLVWREIRRFLKVGAQTVFAPLIQTLLFMMVFTLVRGGEWPGTTRAYADGLAAGLVMMSILSNAFQNSSSSLVSAKQGLGLGLIYNMGDAKADIGGTSTIFSEHNLIAVAGIPDVHRRLRTGQRLSLDGAARRLRDRMRITDAVRAWLRAEGFLEVETPAVVPNPGSDLHLASYAVHGPAAPAGWLITSPEYAMKRLLAGGVAHCAQFGRCWRAGERGDRHQPEFTMLEWYRAWEGLDAVLADNEALVRAAVGAETIQEGQWILYDVEETRKGPEATDVEPYEGDTTLLT